MPDCHFVTRRNFSGDFFARTEKVYYICIPIRPDNGHTVDVAQSVRASDCGSEGRGFEPHLPPLKAVENHCYKEKKPCVSTIYEVFSFYRTPPTLLTFLPSHRNPAANDCRCLFPPPRHPLSAPPAAAAAAPDGRQKNGEGPLSGPSLRSKLRHCSRISEDSFHCMQVDTGSRSGETAGWFHPGYSDCFMTARLLKSLLKKRCAEPDSGNSRIIPIIQICNWSGTAHITS